MSIITLTTDFGLKDYFIGALKGKIMSEYPNIKIVDISHEISSFNIFETVYIVNAVYKNFPRKTVHLIGVDAERHPENRHLAMLWDDHYFVCADNGVLSLLTDRVPAEKIVEMTAYDQSITDMNAFALASCHLARGGTLEAIGHEIKDLKEVKNLTPVLDNEYNTIKGSVIYIDHFGNVITNISKELFINLGKERPYEIRFKSYRLKTILPNYSSIATSSKYPIKNYEGKKLALFNEAGFLEIAIFRSNPKTAGSASSLLGLKLGDTIIIQFDY